MAINDNLHNIYNKLAYDRKQKTLYDRYPGLWRAVVVETNDPLDMFRVRFKMPEMHNFNLSPEDCPWAVPCFEHGGKGIGSWCAPKIGDIIWITFEKNHTYGPIWIGHAEPTRRRYYKLHSLYQRTNLYVDQEGKPLGLDQIPWEEEYFPKDGRPYSCGLKDRYGSMLVIDETGYFPSEHADSPAPVGIDNIAESEFQRNNTSPLSNEPDRKMMAMVSKNGHYMIIGDQGYDWQADFSGDFESDYDIEKSRQEQLIKTLNEDVPNSADRDQRRIEFRSSYGHKFEFRDVGWAANGPSGSSSRSGDWWPSEVTQSKFSERDERWAKIRTKAGHLMQFMDMGAEPGADVFIRRNRIEEIGGKVDEEDDHWQDRDARQMRFVSRYGFKLVIDDRGPSPTDAEGQETPRGNGWLFKGRRDNKGFGWEVNEKDDLNRSLFYSPKSKIIEINDKFDYLMSCTDTSGSISRGWEKLKENEFALAIAMTFDPEKDTYHCKLDLANNYLRMKTPATGGYNQGFESRNEGSGNTVWTEMMDRDNRALICDSTQKLTGWHDPKEQKFILMDDNQNVILVRNKLGKIQIHCMDNMEFKSEANILFEAAEGITFNAQASPFIVNALGGQFVVDAAGIGTTGNVDGSIINGHKTGCFPGPGASGPSPKGGSAQPYVIPSEPPLTPTDRGAVYNGGFAEVSESVVTG